MAAGLPGRLLLPAHWSEFTDGLDRGLAGVQGVDWPYDGPDEWIRRTILLGAPALLTIAATLTFWPARRGRGAPHRGPRGPAAPLRHRGGRAGSGRAGAARARAAAAGRRLAVAAAHAAPRGGRRRGGGERRACSRCRWRPLSTPTAPWWDYRAWDWFGGGKVDHVRLDARVRPARLVAGGRDGAQREVGPAALLEGRDARRVRRPALVRSGGVDETQLRAGGRLQGSVTQGRWDYNEYNPNWDERIRFTVRSLSTPFVVGAGIVLDVDGIPGAAQLGRHRAAPGRAAGSRRATRTPSAPMCRTRPRRRWRAPRGLFRGPDPLHGDPAPEPRGDRDEGHPAPGDDAARERPRSSGRPSSCRCAATPTRTTRPVRGAAPSATRPTRGCTTWRRA